MHAPTSCRPIRRDFLTATKFMNTLIKTGIQMHRATAPLSVGGKTYPAGSYVVKMAQAFRPHVLDMFEPQDHPNDFQYPGGPPIPPYDNAGWTLAYQMGVKFDRVFDNVTGALEPVGMNLIKPAPGRVVEAAGRSRLHRQPWRQRRVHRRQSPAEGGRGSLLRARSHLAERGRHRRDVHHRQAVDAGRAEDGGHRSRADVHRGVAETDRARSTS